MNSPPSRSKSINQMYIFIMRYVWELWIAILCFRAPDIIAFVIRYTCTTTGSPFKKNRKSDAQSSEQSPLSPRSATRDGQVWSWRLIWIPVKVPGLMWKLKHSRQTGALLWGLSSDIFWLGGGHIKPVPCPSLWTSPPSPPQREQAGYLCSLMKSTRDMGTGRQGLRGLPLPTIPQNHLGS